jgi:hypothetical protein
VANSTYRPKPLPLSVPSEDCHARQARGSTRRFTGLIVAVRYSILTLPILSALHNLEAHTVSFLADSAPPILYLAQRCKARLISLALGIVLF